MKKAINFKIIVLISTILLSTGSSIAVEATSNNNPIQAKSDAYLINSPSIDKNLNFLQNKSYAMICFNTGEQISGLNKICYYNCAGSQAAITIPSTQLCPLNIER